MLTVIATRLRNSKYVLLIAPLILALLLFLLGLPWSAQYRHKLKRMIVNAEITLNKLWGHEPRLVSIAGNTGLAGARVQVVDSRSGWATLCDADGRFILPDVLWYPGATYELVVSTDQNAGTIVKVNSPQWMPQSGIIDAGRITLPADSELDLTDLPGLNSITKERYDTENRDYYRKVLNEIIAGNISDEERVVAVNDYVATRLNYYESQWELGSPRRVLERGSQYCGHLTMAMATIIAVAYPVRIINLRDSTTPPNTHAVVEVFYDGDWHLFDPTFGAKFRNNNGRIISYKELRLNPGSISPESFSMFSQKHPSVSLDSLFSVYTSGHHHFYYLSYSCSQYAHAWWAYKNRLRYVPVGGRILMAAAGLRLGSNVTYHIRRTDSDQDEMTFSSHRGANSGCVLDEEESPAINLAPGFYEVRVDLYDGNDLNPSDESAALITDWPLWVKLEVR